ncbi:MAG: ATP-binding protein [Betaproteobacteria bacterium]
MNEHTLTQLRSLRLDGMVRALEEQATSTSASALGFDERFSLVVQRQVSWRDERRVARLLKAAKLKVSSACVQDIDWRASRSLDRSLMAALAGGDWLRHAQNLLITGATGCGKTWLACALAHQAARCDFSVLYTRAGRLFDELQVAYLDDPTLADAILDRVVHSSHRIALKGATLRDNKQIKPLPEGDSDPVGVTA